MPSFNKTVQKTTLGEDLRYAARYYLDNRRSLIVTVMVLSALGAWFNWQRLVAIGIAPLLVAILPCAVMCALGLCMHRSDKSTCAKPSPTAKPEDLDR